MAPREAGKLEVPKFGEAQSGKGSWSPSSNGNGELPAKLRTQVCARVSGQTNESALQPRASSAASTSSNSPDATFGPGHAQEGG